MRRHASGLRFSIAVSICVIGIAASAANAGEAAEPSPRRNVTVVRGTWTGDLECVPTSIEETDTPGAYRVTCLAGTGYEGAFTGHSIITLSGTFDEHGNADATYDETFYGVYLADGSHGSLHFRGRLTVDGATLAFHAVARIIEGTCGFAGSSGDIEYTGSILGGGYTTRWVRSTTPSPEVCTGVGPPGDPARGRPHAAAMTRRGPWTKEVSR